LQAMHGHPGLELMRGIGVAPMSLKT